MTWRHRGALLAGLALTGVAFAPPVGQAAERSLTLHMVLEMLLLALVVPLLAYGACPMLARRRRLQFNPVIGIVTLNVAVFGAQLPGVVDAAARSAGLRDLVQVGFMLGALLFWYPIVGADRISAIAKIGSLMVASVPPTIPGITLALSHHLFYQAFRSIADQQAAGLVLFGTAKFALVGGTFVVLWRMLTPQAEGDDRDDRDRPVEAGPPFNPAWLRHLDSELPAEASRPRLPVGSGR